MKKMLILMTLMMLSSFSLCYSQEDQGKDQDNNFAQNNNYPVEQITASGSIRFGTGMPERGVIRGRVLTNEEYIFQTYIFDKLLKSNRILY